MGFAAENKEAINFFKENKYELLEISNPTVFHFKNFSPLKCNDKIIKITNDNYRLFQTLHEQIDCDMYWNTERIFKALDKWNIYYYENEACKGAIYFCGELPEVFGVDFENGIFENSIFIELMIKCLNVCYYNRAEHLYYFAEGCELDILNKLGFQTLGKYSCYTLRLT